MVRFVIFLVHPIESLILYYCRRDRFGILRRDQRWIDGKRWQCGNSGVGNRKELIWCKFSSFRNFHVVFCCLQCDWLPIFNTRAFHVVCHCWYGCVTMTENGRWECSLKLFLHIVDLRGGICVYALFDLVCMCARITKFHSFFRFSVSICKLGGPHTRAVKS